MSYCFVDAGGVPAEWVEVTAATSDQPTIVHFAGSSPGADSRASDRPLAAKLASVTGARVLTVGCRHEAATSEFAAIEEGIAAWAWLLDEGCDPNTTAFTGSPLDAARTCRVLLAAKEHGLLLPAAGAWCANSVASTPITASRTDLRSRLIQAGARELRPTRI